MRKNLFLLLVLSCGSAWAAFTVTSPTSNQVVSGYFGFTFTVSGYPANTARVQYVCGAHPCAYYGYGAPNANPLAPLYANGESVTAPFSLPWATFWAADGNTTVTATAYDVNGASLGTATQNFVVGNIWPVQCTDLSAPVSALTFGSVTAGILPATVTVTGSCSTDTKQGASPAYYIDGVTQHVNTSTLTPAWATYTANLDETGFSNGVHKVCATWQDNTNFTTYSGGTKVQGAGELCQNVTFANGALPYEVRNAAEDVYLAPSGTFTLSPTLYETDGTTGSPTFAYYSANTTVATVNSSGVVTAASACPSVTVGSCSAQVYSMAETITANDGNGGGNSFTSTMVTFTGHQVGQVLYVPTGACAGTYLITNIDLRVNSLTPTPNLSGSCSGETFFIGPTRASWILVWPTNTMPHFSGTTGQILNSYTSGQSLFMQSLYVSDGMINDNNTAFSLSPSTPSYVYPYNTNPGPLGEVDALGGYNTMETGMTATTTCDQLQGTTLAAWQSSIASYIGNSSTGVNANFTGLSRLKYWYLTGDNVMRTKEYLWPCAYGTPSTWTTPIMAATLAAWQAGNSIVFGVNMQDEGTSSWGARPLAGPNVPSGANSWLTNVVCNGTSCTANGTHMSLNSANQIVITGSVTAGMNTAMGATVGISSVTQSSFTWSSTVAANTYNSSNDAGLSIQQFAAGGYTFNSNTSYIGYDAFANLMVQANSLGVGRINISMSAATGAFCAARAGWYGNGYDGPIHGITQFGGYADFFPDSSAAQPYIQSRNSLNWLIAGATSIGAFTRSNYGCFSPSLPLVNLLDGIESNNMGQNGYPVAIASQVNDTITFSAPHGVVNVVPGETRLIETGSSNSALNKNYYVLSVLSPTQLRVANEVTDFVASPTCSGPGTITFSPSGYQEMNVPFIDATGVNEHLSSLFGTFFWITNPGDTANLLKHRGENISITGCADSHYAAASWVYLAENVTNPLAYTTVTPYAMRQLPSGSGTGGSASIQSDEMVRCGLTGCMSFNENNPDWMFAQVIAGLNVRSTGFRTYYPSGSSARCPYDPAYGFLGGIGNNNVEVFYPTLGSLTVQNNSYPHCENSAGTPNFHATSFASLHLNRWAPFLLQPAQNSPDYGYEFDCTLRSASVGNALVCGNFTDAPQTRTFSLTPILVAGQKLIQQTGGSDGESVITVLNSGTSTATVTLGPGHAVLFIAPTTFAGTINQPTVSVRLADISGATGVSIRYGYDPYLLDVSNANVVDCGSTFPCTLGVDKNFGTVYGRIYYYNSGGAVISTSDIQTF